MTRLPHLLVALLLAVGAALGATPAPAQDDAGDPDRSSAPQRVRITSVEEPLVLDRRTPVRARVTPAQRGRPVRLQRKVDGTWRTVAQARTNRSGVATLTYRPTKAGTMPHRVLAAAYRARPAAVSPARALRVVRQTELLSRGALDGDGSSEPSISADGRWVAFVSDGRLTDADDDAYQDVYLHDRRTGRLRMLLAGLDLHVNRPALSANGRFVAFQSNAANITDEPSYDYDVFVLDRSTGDVELVSRTPAGDPGSAPSYVGGISDDGRFVAFMSYADDVVGSLPPPDESVRHAYVRDRRTDVTRGLDRLQSGWADGNVFGMDISGDGTDVVFTSDDAALDPGMPGTAVFRWEIGDDGTIRNRLNLTPDLVASRPSLNRTGSVLSFTSSTPLGPDDDNGTLDAAVRRADGTIVEPPFLGAEGSEGQAVSASGRYVVATTDTVFGGDVNGTLPDLLVWDVREGTYRLLTRGADKGTSEADVSADGRVLALTSAASNLVTPAPGGDFDVFVRVLP